MTTEQKKKLRVVVIDDSRTYREVLKQLIEADGDLEVVGEAGDGVEGIDTVRSARPDIVTMDLDMPRLDGLAAIQRIIEERPVPILVVTGRPTQTSTVLFEALELGALDLVVKPSLVDVASGAKFRDVLRALSTTDVAAARRKGTPLPKPTFDDDPPESRRRQARAIGIVGSTGGPQATLSILRQFNPGFPLPIMIVQHLPAGFEDAYARFLTASTSLEVEVCRDATALTAGKVFLAPKGEGLVCGADGRVAPAAHADTSNAPSADLLFQSMAETFGDGAVGVMLSGSTTDGIEGLRRLRSKGALTIAEHETSALQSAGPQQAVARGVIERVMSAQLIASTLVSLAYPQEKLSTAPPPNVEP